MSSKSTRSALVAPIPSPVIDARPEVVEAGLNAQVHAPTLHLAEGMSELDRQAHQLADKFGGSVSGHRTRIVEARALEAQLAQISSS